mmetsp:Transcript_67792/g.148800  ORF Transcript_67792/g.148800 Transcript_67792/m.148800 type:complete len:176 (-) Transcript_67792:39-566(-)
MRREPLLERQNLPQQDARPACSELKDQPAAVQQNRLASRSLLWHWRQGGRAAFWWHGWGSSTSKRPRLRSLEPSSFPAATPVALQPRQFQPAQLQPTAMDQKPCQSEDWRENKLAALRQYLEERGGRAEKLEGWSVKTEVRKTGNSAGHLDLYWFSKSGRRFRSMAEVARHFGLT